MKLLLVTPTRREAKALARVRKPALCGPGAEAGERVARRIRADRPDIVIIAGYCGGLDPSAGPGTVILGRQIRDKAGSLLDPDRHLMDEARRRLTEAGVRFVYSRLLTLDHPAATVGQKTALWNEHGAGGVDMESWGIAAAAASAGVSWIALRAVVDPASRALPPALAAWDASTADRRVVRQAITQPRHWPGYLSLARGARAADRALAAALTPVITAAESTTLIELPMVEARP
ncbi:MAG: hypothetical protein ACKVVT_11730 [Dehalococcoidia bacterium]